MLRNSAYKTRWGSKRVFKNVKPKPESNQTNQTNLRECFLKKVVFCLSCHHDTDAARRPVADANYHYGVECFL